MANGKILEFLKNHWLGIASAIVVIVAVGFGVYSCTHDLPVDIDANRNRIVLQIVKSKNK